MRVARARVTFASARHRAAMIGEPTIWKMARILKLTSIIVFISISAYSQKQFNGWKLHTVDLPDRIRAQMACIELGKKNLHSNFDSAYMAIDVRNLNDSSDFDLINGIYAWKVMGPHFQSRLLIYDNNSYFIFKAADVNGVIGEYLQCITQLKLDDYKSVAYLNSISKFFVSALDEEQIDEELTR